jgi:hypothetical protein
MAQFLHFLPISDTLSAVYYNDCLGYMFNFAQKK